MERDQARQNNRPQGAKEETCPFTALHEPSTMSSTILPLELIDKAIGSKLWVIMKGGKQSSIALELPSRETFVDELFFVVNRA